MSYPEHILRVLRQRRGLDEDDTSQDAALNRLTGEQAVRHLCGWHLGDPDWANLVLGWIEDCGGTITWEEPQP